MTDHVPGFRLGTELATSFTATMTERAGDALERIPTPERLRDWLRMSGFAVEACSEADLERARELRESIHVVATSAAQGESLPAAAIRIVNDHSSRGRAAAVLSAAGERQWRLDADSPVRDALGVVAADAIDIIAGERDGRLALCGSPTCRAAFFDTSRSRTRRWCDMGTCGNREKKARFEAKRRGEGRP